VTSDGTVKLHRQACPELVEGRAKKSIDTEDTEDTEDTKENNNNLLNRQDAKAAKKSRTIIKTPSAPRSPRKRKPHGGALQSEKYQVQRALHCVTSSLRHRSRKVAKEPRQRWHAGNTPGHTAGGIPRGISVIGRGHWPYFGHRPSGRAATNNAYAARYSTGCMSRGVTRMPPLARFLRDLTRAVTQ